MAAETLTHQNGVVDNSNPATAKKSRESERRRRRRKQKKNNKSSEESEPKTAEDNDDAKENTDPKQVRFLHRYLNLRCVVYHRTLSFAGF